MKNLNVHDYVNLAKKVCEENNVEINDTLLMMAAYQYSKLPLVSKIMPETVLLKGQRYKSPILVMKTDDDVFIGRDNKYVVDKGEFYESKSNILSGFRRYLNAEDKDNILKIKETIEKSNNFSELSDNIKDVTIYSVLSRLNHKNKDYLRFAKAYNESESLSDYDSKRSTISQLVDCLGSNYLQTSYRNNDIKKIIMEVIDNSAETSVLVDHYTTLISCEGPDINNAEFHTLPDKSKLAYINMISKTEAFEGTILKSLIHSDNPIVDMANSIMFDDFKKSTLLQLKMILKEQSVEEIIENNPILLKIQDTALSLYPNLKSNPIDNIEHRSITPEMIINDKIYPELFVDYYGKDKNSINLAELLDRSGFYTNIDRLVTVQFANGIERVYLPKDYTSFDQSNSHKNFIVDYGFDGISSHYITIARKSPLTMENDAYYIDSLLLNNNTNEHVFREYLEGLYIRCISEQTPIVFERNLTQRYLGDYMNVVLELKDKYNDLIPTYIAPIDNTKLQLLMGRDISYNDILAYDKYFEDLGATKITTADIKSKSESKLKELEFKHAGIPQNKNNI
jgi:hypothetical protein